MQDTASLREIANAANVSVSTVSRALNNNPRISLRRRLEIQATAERMNYRKHLAGAHKASSKTLCLFGLQSPSPFTSAIVEGIHQRAQLEGYSTILQAAYRTSDDLKDTLRKAVEEEYAGLVIASSLPIATADAELLRRAGVEVVRVDQQPLGGDDFDFVASDNYDGAKSLVSHLIAHRCRRIAIISTAKEPRYFSPHWERLAGYKDALGEAGIEVDEKLIVLAPPSETKDGFRILAAREAEYDAVFCIDHGVMRSFLQCVSHEEPRALQRLQFAEFDSPLSGLPLGIKLVSQVQNTGAIGAIAAELLIRRINSGKRYPRQTVRLSTLLESSANDENGQW